MERTRRRFRELFSAPLEGETVRALIVFLTLFLTLSGIVGVLAFRELNLKVLAHRLNLGRDEAQRIANTVAALGRSSGGIDFHLLRKKHKVLEKIVGERMAESPFVRHVEVLDRLGGRLLFVARDPRSGAPTSLGAAELEGLPPPAREEQVVTVELGSGDRPQGEVRVGVAPESFERQLQELRQSVRLKVALAAAFGILVLLVGFLYVLHLIRKNRRLERSRLAAERRSYVGLLASGLAHEIRNPLNAMNMNLQMLEEELLGLQTELGGDYHELLTSTKSEIKRLERLVNNFLAYARPTQPRFEPRDLNGLLHEIARFLQADFQQSSVNLALDLEPLLPTVEIDETQFKQALMNLLVNARQVLRSGGNVTLRSRASASGEVVVEVQDDGPGIPEEARDKIFELFYSSRGGGTGLGLPIARQIVDSHGGSIEVETAAGRGTTFRIRLPRRHERGAPTASLTEAAP